MKYMRFQSVKLMILTMKAQGGYVFDTHVYIYKYKYDHDMSFHLMVMLRSTTGPYGRPVIEVTYGEIIFSLH